jgi:N-acetyl-anhydromuramyl-L-alanine amidase AmpD
MDLEQLYRQYWKMISTQQSEVKWEMSFTIRPVLHIHRTPEFLQQSIDDLQNKLVELRLLNRCSGRFDRKTKAAVEDFQRQNSLKVDGVVGPLTWAALLYPTMAFTKDTSTDNKALVGKIQEILIEEGFEVEVNGQFNRETDRALRRFQRRYGPGQCCWDNDWCQSNPSGRRASLLARQNKLLSKC